MGAAALRHGAQRGASPPAPATHWGGGVARAISCSRTRVIPCPALALRLKTPVDDVRDGRRERYAWCCIARYAVEAALFPEREQALRRGVRPTWQSGARSEHVPCNILHRGLTHAALGHAINIGLVVEPWPALRETMVVP